MSQLFEGWKDENVINVRRIKVKRDGSEKATKYVVLTFCSNDLPGTIETRYSNIRVRSYIPNL